MRRNLASRTGLAQHGLSTLDKRYFSMPSVNMCEEMVLSFWDL